MTLLTVTKKLRRQKNTEIVTVRTIKKPLHDWRGFFVSLLGNIGNIKNMSENTDSKKKKQRVLQREAINFDFEICEFPWTEKQKELIEIIENKKNKIILIKGCAGTSKSLVAIYCALKLLKNKRMKEIFYVRNPVESSSASLGFLPGSFEDKVTPYMQPMYDKLDELVTKKEDLAKLNKDQRVTPLPVNFMRGRSLNASFIFVDEGQNLEVKDFLTCITRMGKFSKVVIAGDTRQSDIRHSGFSQVYNLFDNEESRENGIVTFKFGPEDIMRDESLKFIIKKFETLGT